MSGTAWGLELHAAQCANCRSEFLVAPNAGAPICPGCLAARLEPIPALEHTEPPELILPFSVADATLDANLERWRRDIPFKPASLELAALRKQLMPVYVPMYLADASVWGTWDAQMGYDYLVASSEERYSNGQWVSQRINETRTRWEPRAGEISRQYENIPAPAFENHAALMAALGDSNVFPYDTSRAVPYSGEVLKNALVRASEIENAAAWNIARLELERRAANDCRAAAGAQRQEKFSWRAAFGEPHWTLMLLPTYVTSYSDDDNNRLPVRINGQTGHVSGLKRASMKKAQSWSLGLGAVALLAFLLTVLIALGLILTRQALNAAGILLVATLLLTLAAPVPMIVAWQYNRVNVSAKGTML